MKRKGTLTYKIVDDELTLVCPICEGELGIDLEPTHLEDLPATLMLTCSNVDCKLY